MNPTFRMMCRRTFGSALLLCSLAFSGIPGAVSAQFNPGQIASSVVRVIVGAGTPNSRAASGFVWKEDGLVVTTLHAVPAGLSILVKCQGRNYPATVAGVFKDADLIALKTDPMPNCAPLSETLKSTEAPQFSSELHTLGFHESAQAKTSRSMKKGFAEPGQEILRYLTSGNTLEMLSEYNIPSLDLEIYYVQGGLLPGYSGAPVFDSTNRLVGIVDGGLNKGMSNYNWVIPAVNLATLEQKIASAENAIPPEIAKMQGILFSSPTAEESELALVEFSKYDEYLEQERNFRFVRSKTLSLDELLATADDPEGVEILLREYAYVAALDDAAYQALLRKFRFDIYEEEDYGLIIAVPAGQKLEFKTFDGESGYLVSEPDGESGSWIMYEVHQGYSPTGTEPYSVDDPQFQDKVVAGILEECKLLDEICEEDMMVEVDYGDGLKVMKIGMLGYSDDPDGLDPYDYWSIAIDGDFVFRTFGRIYPYFEDLDRCGGAITCPSDPELAVEQYLQLLAVHLTTFRFE